MSIFQLRKHLAHQLEKGVISISLFTLAHTSGTPHPSRSAYTKTVVFVDNLPKRIEVTPRIIIETHVVTSALKARRRDTINSCFIFLAIIALR